MKLSSVFAGLATMALATASVLSSDALYPPKENRKPSPGNTSYFIDPIKGDDKQSGLKQNLAWRSFSRINQLVLAPGDQVKITAPGSFDQTLMIVGSGTADSPVEVSFASGRYDFHTKNLCRRKFNISNTNASPEADKLIAIFLQDTKHINVAGPGADIICRGKMMEVCIDRCENVTVSGLSFDYQHPTVTEYKIVVVGDGYVDLQIHKDSQYAIDGGKLTWKGEGWSFVGGLGQELNLETNEVRRRRDPLNGLTMKELKPFLVRASGKHKMKAGHIYQIREPFRDYAAVFTRRSKDITWKDVHFRFLHGMGLVNQFSENLTFDGVKIAPDPASGRTTAAWADGIQVSGCKGKLLVKDCVFSGAHDDAINIHGTHLRLTEKVSDRQIKVKFIHNQTYGFMAFNAGDDVEFIRWDSLKPYSANKVKDAKLLNPKEMLLTLEKPFPADFKEKDVLENVTWTPEVEIRGCIISRIPTRGFLITTRRKVLVEDNTFNVTHMSAILLEDDARGWFESGCVRDMTIRNNRFIRCAEPVVNINPQNGKPNNAVHQNIRIEGNHFVLRGKTSVKGHSSTGLTVTGNTTYSEPIGDDASSIKIIDCEDVKISNNRYLPLQQWTEKTGGAY
ncbi:right-handed parallel beta-helix repeat-containing protein [Rubritalea profundi]|uniref:Uncharacterized protein n=1 Tax=Rubritalea profundi TaxID=1658618 RepID=A0A2S7U4W0_9BACT|nr:right-handed parallel beta-helix repeat-containing protein [Rubritalea profundi]PQJ29471.1 hypothetical protein BSZ32_13875 [Rubritalea profundi]